MLTAIENLWNDMEKSIHSSADNHSSGWVLRLARPDNRCPLYAACQLKEGRRALLIQLPGELMPSPRRWPQCRGLEAIAVRFDGREHFGVALKDAAFADVFASLANDLARRLDTVTSPDEQAQVFLSQLARWQKFLSASSEGLSREEQQGLWGELSVLRDILLPHGGPAIIEAWKGPEGAHQDFQFGTGAIEVKTTQAGAPQVVRISNERQLDHAYCPDLLLCVVAVDSRENAGEHLPGMVNSIRSILPSSGVIRDLFDDRLLSAGYLDAHARRYMDTGYILRSRSFYQVNDSFPAITERLLPSGVGDVSYALSISACDPYKLSENSTADQLKEIIHQFIMQEKGLQ